MLKDFASFLRRHHLREIAKRNLHALRDLDLPLLRQFASVPDDAMLDQMCASLNEFLADLEVGRGFEKAAQSLKRWEDDQLPGISKHDIEPGDLVITYAAQKKAILSFLPEYTTDVSEAVRLATALVDFYVKLQKDAFELLTRLRTEASHEIARLAEEKASAFEHWRSLMENAPNTIVVINRDCEILFTNRETFGIRPEEAAGSSVLDQFPEEQHETMREAVATVLQTGNTVQIELSRPEPDGNVSWFHSTLGPIWRDDEIVSLIVIRSDITDRKRWENALRRKEQQLTEAQRIAHLGSWEWTVGAGELVCSEEFVRILGLPGDSRVSLSSIIDMALEDDRPRVIQALEKAQTNLEPFEYEMQCLLPGRQTRILHTVGNVQLDSRGRLAGLIATVQDITDRRAVERMKDEFISVVSHELRTPLAAIRGSIGLVAGGAYGTFPEKAKRMLEIAANNTDRLVRLINDILDIERMESGKAVLKKEACGVDALLRRVVDDLGQVAAEAKIRLAIESAPGFVWADSDRITQVFTNLLSNALKFSPRDSTVLLSAEHQGDRILFEYSGPSRTVIPGQGEHPIRSKTNADSAA